MRSLFPFFSLFFAFVAHERVRKARARGKEQDARNEMRGKKLPFRPAAVHFQHFGVKKHGEQGPERQPRNGEKGRSLLFFEQDGQPLGRGEKPRGKPNEKAGVHRKHERVLRPIGQADRLQKRVEIPRQHEKGGSGQPGHHLRNGDERAEQDKQKALQGADLFQGALARREQGEKTHPDGEQDPEQKQKDAERRGLFPFQLSERGGIGARHQPRKQRDDGEGADIQQPAHRKKAERKAQRHADDDGQQERRARFEFFEKVADGVQQFFVQAEKDGDGGAADPRHDDGKPDKKAEHAALCRFPAVFIAQIGRIFGILTIFFGYVGLFFGRKIFFHAFLRSSIIWRTPGSYRRDPAR